MAWPPQELMCDPALTYADRLLAAALWWPVKSSAAVAVNFACEGSRRARAGGPDGGMMSRSTYQRGLRKLRAQGWIEDYEEPVRELGRRVAGAVRLFAPEKPCTADGASPHRRRRAPPVTHGGTAGDSPGHHPRSLDAPPVTPRGEGGELEGTTTPTPLPPTTIVIREPHAPTKAARAAEHLFFELEHARRSLATELGERWAVIRSARLIARLDEHHENLVFAVEAEGLDVVTEVVCWGWRQAAAGAREVDHQRGTFSGSGGAWRRLLEDYRAAQVPVATAPARPSAPVPSDDEIARIGEMSAAVAGRFR